MALNQFCIAPLFIGLISSVSLLGCQHTPPNSKTKTIAATTNTSNSTDDNWSTATPQSYLMQTLTRYDWQLAQVSRADGKAEDFKHNPPLMMEVRPDELLFKEGCHRYKIRIERAYPMPYPYSMSKLMNLDDNCAAQYNMQGSGAVQQVLETIFSPRSYLYFNFRPLMLDTKPATKQLALDINNGLTLIFAGAPKPEQPISGLPITNELLERYQWRVMRATDSNNQAIPELSYTETPVTANFYTDSNRRSASFSSGCNGVSGGYALTVGQTLLIGSAPQTMLGCGPKLEAAENKIRALELSSSSQLALTLSKNTKLDDAAHPHYLLMQKLNSGETLIWQNEEKGKR